MSKCAAVAPRPGSGPAGADPIGLALGQATNTLRQLIAVGGWHSRDHAGPVFEGDTVCSRIEVAGVSEGAGGLLG
jgi:acyl dehydratase